MDCHSRIGAADDVREEWARLDQDRAPDGALRLAALTRGLTLRDADRLLREFRQDPAPDQEQA